jgi:hypothetical protein
LVSTLLIDCGAFGAAFRAGFVAGFFTDFLALAMGNGDLLNIRMMRSGAIAAGAR